MSKTGKKSYKHGQRFLELCNKKKTAVTYTMVRVEEYEHKTSSWLPNIQSFASYCCTIMNILAIFPEEAPSAIFIGANLCFC